MEAPEEDILLMVVMVHQVHLIQEELAEEPEEEQRVIMEVKMEDKVVMQMMLIHPNIMEAELETQEGSLVKIKEQKEKMVQVEH